MKIKTVVEKIELPEPVEFEWDDWNISKNRVKHNVSVEEAEQLFGDPNKTIFHDALHSQKEKRFIVIGKALNSRILYAAFILKNKKVRIISVRDLNRKERYLY